MKTLLSLFVALLCAAPLYADQALVLTEIEQIQEKIWYLQRDLATQKALIEKQPEQFNRLLAGTEKKQRDLESHLAAATKTLGSQQEALRGIESAMQSLKETVQAMVNEFNQQNQARLQQQAEKSDSQEGVLRTLREELNSSRKQTEQALTETRQQLTETQEQLAETRSELAALKTNEGGRFDQLILWGGGISLALAVLLTITLAFRSGKSRQYVDKSGFPPKHEL